MKSKPVTHDEMQKRVVHFKDLVPYKRQQKDLNGIPPGAFERIAAHSVYPIMVPEGYKGRSTEAPIKGAKGLILTITESPPGDGAALHIHEQTIENFFCLSGRFKIFWGDKGENYIILEPLDCNSIPPGVVRSFQNISNEIGRLLAVIHVQGDDQADRIAFVPELKEEIEEKYGASTIASLNAIGVNFDAGVETI